MSHFPQPADDLTEDEIFSMLVVNPPGRGEGVGDCAVEVDNVVAQQWDESEISEGVMETLLMNSKTGVCVDEAVDHQQMQPASNDAQQTVDVLPDPACVTDGEQTWAPHELALIEGALDQVVKDFNVRQRRQRRGGANSSSTTKPRPVRPKQKRPLKRKTGKPTVKRSGWRTERENPVATTYGQPAARTVGCPSTLKSVLRHPFGLLTPGIAFTQPNMYPALNSSESLNPQSEPPVLQAQVAAPIATQQGHMSAEPNASPAPEDFCFTSRPAWINPALFGLPKAPAVDSTVIATSRIDSPSETFWLQVLAANGGLSLDSECQVINDPRSVSSESSLKYQTGSPAQPSSISESPHFPDQAQYSLAAPADSSPEPQGVSEYDVALMCHQLAWDIRSSA